MLFCVIEVCATLEVCFVLVLLSLLENKHRCIAGGSLSLKLKCDILDGTIYRHQAYLAASTQMNFQENHLVLTLKALVPLFASLQTLVAQLPAAPRASFCT